jgi:hypothetical protein
MLDENLLNLLNGGRRRDPIKLINSNPHEVKPQAGPTMPPNMVLKPVLPPKPKS